MQIFVLTRLIFDGRHFERCDVVATKTTLEEAKAAGQADFGENFDYLNGGEPLELKWSGNTESDRDLVAKTQSHDGSDPVYWEIFSSEI